MSAKDFFGGSVKAKLTETEQKELDDQENERIQEKYSKFDNAKNPFKPDPEVAADMKKDEEDLPEVDIIEHIPAKPQPAPVSKKPEAQSLQTKKSVKWSSEVEENETKKVTADINKSESTDSEDEDNNGGKPISLFKQRMMRRGGF